MDTTRPLRAALLGNALFSSSCGVLMLLVPSRIGALLGLQAPLVLQAIGLGLILFALDLIHQATRPRMATWRALYASAGDLLWVLATLAGVLIFPAALSSSGLLAVIAVAGVVLGLGAWQLWAIQHTHRAPSGRGYRHCLGVAVDAPANALWRVVGEIGEIERYMPSLRSSELLGGARPGVGAVRHCVDQAGRSWCEECIAFEPGRSFTVRFRAGAPGFPFPAKEMHGGWEVATADAGSKVTVWWELELRQPLLAPVILPLLAFQADRDFTRVIERMAGAALADAPERAAARGDGVTVRRIPSMC